MLNREIEAGTNTGSVSVVSGNHKGLARACPGTSRARVGHDQVAGDCEVDRKSRTPIWDF